MVCQQTMEKKLTQSWSSPFVLKRRSAPWMLWLGSDGCFSLSLVGNSTTVPSMSLFLPLL